MNRTFRIAVPAMIVLAVLGWAGYQYFIVADSPDEVSTDAALEQLTQDLAAAEPTDAQPADAQPASDEPAGEQASDEQAVETQPAEQPAQEADATESIEEAPAPAAADSVAGVWVIDDDFGDFAFENASGSFAGFRVEKELFVGGQQIAVGRSGGVTGSITIGDGAVAGGEIVVDTSAMQSDIGARENAIAEAIKSNQFASASFVITEPTQLDTAALEAGETVTANITGELTIAGTTNVVTVAAEATIAEAGIGLIVGTADLVWADFDVDTPSSSAGTVADEGVLEFQLIVRTAG